MFRVLSGCLVALFICQPAIGQDTLSAAGTAAPISAEDFVREFRRYEEEGQKYSSFDLAQQVRALQESLRLRRKPNDFLLSQMSHPDSLRASGYLAVLRKRRGAGEREAAFQYGLHELTICSVLMRSSEGQAKNSVCEEALESLKVAAGASDPRAMAVIAAIYEGGIGVSLSNFVAADWYIRATRQYDQEGQRDRALETLERALKVVPDHPAGLQLRNKLLR